MSKPCAVCSAPRDADVWETPVCLAHWNLWIDESPSPTAVEAKAQEQHFEVSPHGFRRLRAGVLENFYRKWTRAWVELKRAKVAA